MRSVDLAPSCAGCGRCGGVWLPMQIAKDLGTSLTSVAARRSAELGEALTATGAAPTDAHTDRTLLCPLCGGNMGKHRFPPLVLDVDRCLTDGMFFDRGELREVLLRARRAPSVKRSYQTREGYDPTVPLVVVGAAAGANDELVETVADFALEFVVEGAIELVFGVVESAFD